MGCFMVCHKCQHENAPPTDIEVLDGTYQCCNCEYPLGHSITAGEVFQGLVERIEKLEQAQSEPEPDTVNTPQTSDEYVMVNASTVLYLLGEEGEFERPEHAGPFWWRTILRNSIKLSDFQWIDCVVRLPCEEDADVEGKVWGWYQYRHEWCLVSPYQFVKGSDICTHWMATGLNSPGIDPNKK